MKRILILVLPLLVGLVLSLSLPAAGQASPSEDIVRELTGPGNPDYRPKKEEYRLDPSSDFHYSSDPFLRDKKEAEDTEKKKESPISLSFGKDERIDPVTGAPVREDKNRPESNDVKGVLDSMGGKVQVDVKVLEF